MSKALFRLAHFKNRNPVFVIVQPAAVPRGDLRRVRHLLGLGGHGRHHPGLGFGHGIKLIDDMASEGLQQPESNNRYGAEGEAEGDRAATIVDKGGSASGIAV